MKKTFILFSFSLGLAFTAMANDGTAPLNKYKGEKVETTQTTVKAKLATQIIKESIIPFDVVELSTSKTNPSFILDYSISGKGKHGRTCKNGAGSCKPKT